jgi:hypothetical protein
VCPWSRSRPLAVQTDEKEVSTTIEHREKPLRAQNMFRSDDDFVSNRLRGLIARHGPASSMIVHGGNTTGDLFQSLNGRSGITSDANKKKDGVSRHIINQVAWIDVNALVRVLKLQLNPRDDIMAPAAAIDMDSVRMIEDVGYISSPALVKRFRMNDLGRQSYLMNIKSFLSSAVGPHGFRVNERLSPEHYVDIYVPNAKLAIDVDAGTLAVSNKKIRFLSQRNISHVTFTVSTVAPILPKTSAFGTTGSFSSAMLNSISVRNTEAADMERLLTVTIPHIFRVLMSSYSRGIMEDSTSINSYMRGTNSAVTYDRAAKRTISPTSTNPLYYPSNAKRAAYNMAPRPGGL